MSRELDWLRESRESIWEVYTTQDDEAYEADCKGDSSLLYGSAVRFEKVIKRLRELSGKGDVLSITDMSVVDAVVREGWAEEDPWENVHPYLVACVLYHPTEPLLAEEDYRVIYEQIETAPF